MKKEKENRYALIDQLPEQTQRDKIWYACSIKTWQKKIQKCMVGSGWISLDQINF